MKATIHHELWVDGFPVIAVSVMSLGAEYFAGRLVNRHGEARRIQKVENRCVDKLGNMTFLYLGPIEHLLRQENTIEPIEDDDPRII